MWPCWPQVTPPEALPVRSASATAAYRQPVGGILPALFRNPRYVFFVLCFAEHAAKHYMG